MVASGAFRAASPVFVAVLLVLVALAATLTTLLAFDALRGNATYPWPGAAGGCGSGVCVSGASYSVLSGAQVRALAAPSTGLSVDRTHNTVTVVSAGATLFVQAGPPISTARDEYFVLYGLVDPTVVVPRGLVFHLVAANLDDSAAHNFGLTTMGPPYGSVPPMMGGHWPMMSPWLGPGNDTRGYPSYAADVRFASAGTWYYICSISGHAQDGMFGTIEVTG